MALSPSPWAQRSLDKGPQSNLTLIAGKARPACDPSPLLPSSLGWLPVPLIFPTASLGQGSEGRSARREAPGRLSPIHLLGFGPTRRAVWVKLGGESPDLTFLQNPGRARGWGPPGERRGRPEYWLRGFSTGPIL